LKKKEIRTTESQPENVLNLPILPEELKIKNPTQCPTCKNNPKTQTTYTRPIKTLSGERELSIQKKYCKIHGLINNENVSFLNKIIFHYGWTYLGMV